MSKKLIKQTSLVLGVITISLLATSWASAKEENNYPSIVQKIADKFNLSEADVQKVFDEERDERHSEVQASWNERLDDLVNDGKITSEQRDEILKKHEEIHNKMLELKDMNPEERREEMKKIQEDFKEWANKQEIDLPILGPIKFMHKGPGVGGHKMMFHEKI